MAFHALGLAKRFSRSSLFAPFKVTTDPAAPSQLPSNQGIYQQLDDSKKEIRLLTIERLHSPWLSRFENWPLFGIIDWLRYRWVSYFNTDRFRPIRCRLE